jgi:hypothetical protein
VQNSTKSRPLDEKCPWDFWNVVTIEFWLKIDTIMVHLKSIIGRLLPHFLPFV